MAARARNRETVAIARKLAARVAITREILTVATNLAVLAGKAEGTEVTR